MSEIKGKVIAVLPQTSGEGKNGTWKSQDFVIETDGQYPKKVCLNIYGEKIPIPKIDEKVCVSYEPESREYNGKWFTNLKAFKVDVIGGGVATQTVQPKSISEESGESLPF